MSRTKLDLACIRPACTRLRKARGLCSKHYENARLAGEFGKPAKECQIDGCHKAHSSKGFCRPHYEEFRRGRRDGRIARRSEQHVAYLRGLVGVPAAGPTDEQQHRWDLQEAS